MSTVQRKTFRDAAFSLTYDKDKNPPTEALVAKDLAIPNDRPDSEFYWAVLWTGQRYETHKVSILFGETWGQVSSAEPSDSHHEVVQSVSHIIFPIDPRTTAKDWHGAPAARANTDGDGWLPDYDVGVNHDQEELLWGSVVNRFHPALSETLLKIVVAPNEVQVQTHRTAYESLLRFQSDVLTDVITEARTAHIGYYDQNPQDGHIQTPIKESIERVEAAWQAGDANAITRLRTIRDTVAALKTAVSGHPYEERWVRDARLAREAKEAAEKSSGC